MQSVVAATTLAKLFAALVLFLPSIDEERQRLRWVAGGISIIVIGQLLVQYLQPLLFGSPEHNAQLYDNVIRWTAACMLFAVGLLPTTPPRFSPLLAVTVLAVFGGFSAAAFAGADLLPPLVQDPPFDAAESEAALPGLTGWYWALSWLPLVLAVAAAAGAFRLNRNGRLAGWILVVAVLLAGSQLHNFIWPSSGSPVLSTTHLLRLALATAVVLGGIIELRRIAAERSSLLSENAPGGCGSLRSSRPISPRWSPMSSVPL